MRAQEILVRERTGRKDEVSGKVKEVTLGPAVPFHPFPGLLLGDDPFCSWVALGWFQKPAL